MCICLCSYTYSGITHVHVYGKGKFCPVSETDSHIDTNQLDGSHHPLCIFLSLDSFNSKHSGDSQGPSQALVPLFRSTGQISALQTVGFQIHHLVEGT